MCGGRKVWAEGSEKGESHPQGIEGSKQNAAGFPKSGRITTLKTMTATRNHNNHAEHDSTSSTYQDHSAAYVCFYLGIESPDYSTP